MTKSLSGRPQHEKTLKETAARMKGGGGDINPLFTNEILKLGGRLMAQIRRGVNMGDNSADNYYIQIGAADEIKAEHIRQGLEFFVSDKGIMTASGFRVVPVTSASGKKGREAINIGTGNEPATREQVPNDNTREMAAFIRKKTVDRFQAVPRSATPAAAPAVSAK